MMLSFLKKICKNSKIKGHKAFHEQLCSVSSMSSGNTVNEIILSTTVFWERFPDFSFQDKERLKFTNQENFLQDKLYCLNEPPLSFMNDCGGVIFNWGQNIHSGTCSEP